MSTSPLGPSLGSSLGPGLVPHPGQAQSTPSQTQPSEVRTCLLRILHPPLLGRMNAHLDAVAKGHFRVGEGFEVDWEGNLRRTVKRGEESAKKKVKISLSSSSSSSPQTSSASLLNSSSPTIDFTKPTKTGVHPSLLTVCYSVSLVPTGHSSTFWTLSFPDDYYNHLEAREKMLEDERGRMEDKTIGWKGEWPLEENTRRGYDRNDIYKRWKKRLTNRFPGKYPVRLASLPTLTELHRIHGPGGRNGYSKSTSISQVFLVHHSRRSMELNETSGRTERRPSYPTYTRDGVLCGSSVAMRDVVTRRYERRLHDRGVISRTNGDLVSTSPSSKGVSTGIPGPQECFDTCAYLSHLISVLSGVQENGKFTSTLAKRGLHKTHVEEEIDVVDYEDWMDDFGRDKAGGREIDERDKMTGNHPGLWVGGEEGTKKTEGFR